MALLFISNIVPDKAPYNGVGFTRSSNNVFLGIEKALPPSPEAELLSCRPIVSFPKGPLWLKGEDVKLDSGRTIHILPCLNIKIIKNIFWGLQVKRFIKKWSRRNADEARNVMIYNLITPLVGSVYKSCKKFGCKLTAILYDLGVPPKRQGLSRLSMLGHRYMEKQALKYIPILDGRVVINENIIDYYSPGKSYIHIDGGINDIVISRLFPLAPTPTIQYIFVLAGLLWDQNGTKLVLDCLKKHLELQIEVVFAGPGNDIGLIEKSARTDKRIRYVGILNQKDLFELYEKADVLLNLRIEEEVDFHFPSKLLEYMVTGKHVLSTPIAHAERDYGDYVSFLHDISPDGLADAINRIISTDKQVWVDQGKRAREFMLENRTWTSRTQEILAYISKL